MRKLSLVLLLCAANLAIGQVSVILAPVPQLQFFDQSGRPLAFGCVFSYISGTTTPLATYVDFSGTIINPNPVVLSAGGSANIWLLSGQSYSLKVKASGGIKCASGSTLYTVQGIGGGSSIQTTNVVWSSTPQFTVAAQTQLFTITLAGNTAALPLSVIGIIPPSVITFQITQDSSGGHTFTWPSNVNGGATVYPQANSTTTQQFVWNGTIASAVGPAVVNTNSVGGQPLLETGPIVVNGTINSGQLSASLVDSAGGYQLGSTAPLNHVLVGNGTVYVDSANIPVSTLPIVLCSDGATLTVHASTTSQQILKTCLIAAGSINAVGKTVHLVIGLGAAFGGSASTSALYLGYGTTAGLGTYTQIASQGSATTAYNYNLAWDCTVTAPGVSGSLSCVQLSTSALGSVAMTAASIAVTLSSVDLTSNLYVGASCTFGTGSTDNSCFEVFEKVEQPN
jgi:hypothetical protein